MRRGCVHPQRPGALPFLNHDKGVWTEFGLKAADALRVNGGPVLDAPLLGVNRRAQLPTGVLLKAGLSPGVKVLDLKERPRYRRCGRKWRAVVSVKWWGQGQRAAPRPRGWTPSLCVWKNGRALPVKTRLAGLYGGAY